MSPAPRAIREIMRVVLAEIEARQSSEDIERARFWTVRCTHVLDEPYKMTLYGSFPDPVSALRYARTLEQDLNDGYTTDEEGGFRCSVHPVLPANDGMDSAEQNQ